MHLCIRKCLWALLALLHSTVAVGGLIEYTGDVLPGNSNPPFIVSGGAANTQSVANGILTLDAPSSGISYNRTDPILRDDLAVFEFRARLITSQASSASYRALVRIVWGEVGSEMGLVGMSISTDTVQVGRSTQGPSSSFALDTSAFHTFTLVKQRHQDLRFYIDGEERLVFPYSQAIGGLNMIGSVEGFYALSSKTEWDFFRYAIGDDALDLIPVPEPCTWILTISGIASLGMSCARRASAI
jgi:hypothetical protein